MIATVKQAEFEEKLTAANEKLIIQAEEIAKHVTGGDSFAYLMFNSGTTLLMAIHRGKYALSDVEVRVVDLDTLLPDSDIHWHMSFRIGSMPPGTATQVGQYPIDASRPVRNLNIFFVARNGFWFQELRQRLVGDQWLSAWRVRFQQDVDTGNYDRDVGSDVHPDYPRNAHGSVDWDALR